MACVRVLPPPWGPQDAHKEPGYLYPEEGQPARPPELPAHRATGPGQQYGSASARHARALGPGASPGNTPSPPLCTSGGQRSRRRGLFPWTVVTSPLAWPRDLGTSFRGPHGALGVTAKGHRHPAQRTRGGKTTQFSNIAFPASRRPPLDSAHFVSTLAARRNTGARGTVSASQGGPAGAARARYYRENSGKVFAGRPYLDLAPLPAQQSPMQLTPGRAAGHPPGHPGARPRLRGSQEIGNC